MSRKEEKTNVMRILDQKKIEYKSYNYLQTGAVNGMEVAEALDEDPGMVFKTLVTVGKSKTNYVFVVPVNKELNLTGYVHGGCSPIGMKKQFSTTIDRSAENYGRIIFSAGKIGYQVEVSLEDLEKVIRYQLDEITE